MYSGVFAELEKTIAMSAMEIVMLPPMVRSVMLAEVSMCIVGEGVEIATAVVGEAIFIPDRTQLLGKSRSSLDK